MVNGFINLNKDSGLSSHAAVNQVRRLFGLRAVGHMGTLDPAAQGVLPLALGKATRLIPFVEGDDKVYRAELVLGLATDTYDTSGNTLAAADTSHISQEAIVHCLPLFTGPQNQVPPMYSAIKVGGKKLYEFARRGETIALTPRPIKISRLVLTKLIREANLTIATLEIECSKGTYIRSLCHDLGQVMGVPACMGNLWRLRSGPFTEESSVTLTTLAAKPMQYLISINSMLQGFPRLHLTLSEARRFVQGQRLRVVCDINLQCPVYYEELFIGLGEVEAGVLFPTKVMAQEVDLPCL